tara:strand:- start:270 stop:848 length:579 start_codon:yes stop_codon:yes gene_type:complete
MATLNATNLKHASSGSNNIILAADGSTTISNLSNAGKVIQVQSVTKTDTFSSSESSGNYSGPAISLNFTATSTSNKLLIMANLMVAGSHSSERLGIILFAGGSKLTGAVGNADGSRRRISMGGYNDADNSYVCISHSHYFTPASTNQITYDYRLHNGRGATGTVYLNRDGNNDDNTHHGRGTSTITIMEIAA